MILSQCLRNGAKEHFNSRRRRLRFYVLYTGPDAAALALARIVDVAAFLHIDVVLLAALPVPNSLPSAARATLVESLKRGLLEQVLGLGLEVAIEVMVCRSGFMAYQQALPAESNVVVGERRNWWWSRGRRLARRLRRDGHIVFLIEPERARNRISPLHVPTCCATLSGVKN